MTDNRPLVTIVTPSFNQGRFIRDTIESVLSQGYRHIEYIVMLLEEGDEGLSCRSLGKDRVVEVDQRTREVVAPHVPVHFERISADEKHGVGTMEGRAEGRESLVEREQRTRPSLARVVMGHDDQQQDHHDGQRRTEAPEQGPSPADGKDA